MNKKVRWITETAVMLALLVALQALTKGFGQFVTGSCVNAVLAVTVLTAGPGSGIVVAVLIAALGKFAVLYFIVVKVVCGVMAPSLLAAGTLKEPMLKALPATFSWPQLITALIGGGIALLIVPVIRKALHR